MNNMDGLGLKNGLSICNGQLGLKNGVSMNNMDGLGLKNGLYIYSPVREDFNDLCKENDKMQTFIDFTFEITNDNSDRIHKDHFKQLYNDHFKTKMDWIKLLGV